MVPQVWGFFEVDCASNSITGPRTALTDVLRKMTIRYAPGALSSVEWSPDDSALDAAGDDAPAGHQLEAFLPTDDASTLQVEQTGLEAPESTPWFGGTLLRARATGGPWSIRITR
jgi:hypothetical protein